MESKYVTITNDTNGEQTCVIDLCKLLSDRIAQTVTNVDEALRHNVCIDPPSCADGVRPHQVVVVETIMELLGRQLTPNQIRFFACFMREQILNPGADPQALDLIPLFKDSFEYARSEYERLGFEGC